MSGYPAILGLTIEGGDTALFFSFLFTGSTVLSGMGCGGVTVVAWLGLDDL